MEPPTDPFGRLKSAIASFESQLQGMKKAGFQPPAGGAQQMPPGGAMPPGGGGMPPGGAPPMDPNAAAMASGGMPPGGAMPPGGGGAPPMDPSMMAAMGAGGMPPGGAPPQAPGAGGMPPEVMAQFEDLLAQMGEGLQGLVNVVQGIQQSNEAQEQAIGQLRQEMNQISAQFGELQKTIESVQPPVPPGAVDPAAAAAGGGGAAPAPAEEAMAAPGPGGLPPEAAMGAPQAQAPMMM